MREFDDNFMCGSYAYFEVVKIHKHDDDCLS